MARRLFIGNLPYSASDGDLRAHFTDAGFNVSDVVVISDRETGQSKGFGFVELVEDDAQGAIEALNGSELGGRRLRVSEAHERERRDPPQTYRPPSPPPPPPPPNESRKQRRKRKRGGKGNQGDDW